MTISDLIKKLTGVLPPKVLEEIPAVAQKFEINTPVRLAHFLAQCGHESIGFKATVENLNYSVDALNRVFAKYFPNNLAVQYARQPEKIGARVYGGRMGNGPEATKEGFRYRGRGYIQLTGKNNYSAFSKAVGVDCVADPELVATKYPLLSAAWFWNSRALNLIADKGPSDIVVTEITKKVNGGTNGLADRLAHFKKYYSILTTNA